MHRRRRHRRRGDGRCDRGHDKAGRRWLRRLDPVRLGLRRLDPNRNCLRHHRVRRLGFERLRRRWRADRGQAAIEIGGAGKLRRRRVLELRQEHRGQFGEPARIIQQRVFRPQQPGALPCRVSLLHGADDLAVEQHGLVLGLEQIEARAQRGEQAQQCEGAHHAASLPGLRRRIARKRALRARGLAWVSSDPGRSALAVSASNPGSGRPTRPRGS